MKNFDTNDYILVIVTAILVLLALGCSQKQLNPNELPSDTRFQSLEDSESHYLKAEGRDYIGIRYSYLPDEDYFMVMVVPHEPVERITLDDGTTIDVDYFRKINGSASILRRDLFTKFAKSSYLKANGKKYRMNGLASMEAQRMLIVSK